VRKGGRAELKFPNGKVPAYSGRQEQLRKVRLGREGRAATGKGKVEMVNGKPRTSGGGQRMSSEVRVVMEKRLVSRKRGEKIRKGGKKTRGDGCLTEKKPCTWGGVQNESEGQKEAMRGLSFEKNRMVQHEKDSPPAGNWKIQVIPLGWDR